MFFGVVAEQSCWQGKKSPTLIVRVVLIFSGRVLKADRPVQEDASGGGSTRACV